jgi:hypothetical protein
MQNSPVREGERGSQGAEVKCLMGGEAMGGGYPFQRLAINLLFSFSGIGGYPRKVLTMLKDLRGAAD